MGFARQRGDFGWQVTALEAVLRGGLSRVMVRTEVSVARVPCLLPDLGESESSLVGGRRGGGQRETRHRMDAGKDAGAWSGPPPLRETMAGFSETAAGSSGNQLLRATPWGP